MTIRRSILFLLSFSIALSNYRKIDVGSLTVYIHQDIYDRDLDLDFVERAYYHIDSYLHLSEDIGRRVYVTLYNLDRSSSDLDLSRESEKKSLFIKFQDIDIYDRDSFKFIFTYELSKQLIQDKIKESMFDLLRLVDYIYPVRDLISKTIYPKWALDGLALFIAEDFMVKYIGRDSERALPKLSIKLYRTLFLNINKSYYGRYIFADWLSYANSLDSVKLKESITSLVTDVVEQVKINRAIVDIFIDKFGSDRFNSWLDSFESIDDSISTISTQPTSISKYPILISNIRVHDGHLYYLREQGGKRALCIDGRVKYGFDIEHYEIFDGDIYFTVRKLNIDRDSFNYDLYRDGSLIRRDVAPKFLVVEEGFVWIYNHGFRDRVLLNDREILPLSYGLKIESILYLNGKIYASAKRESEEFKIYNLSDKLIIHEGRDLSTYDGDLYFSFKDRLLKYTFGSEIYLTSLPSGSSVTKDKIFLLKRGIEGDYVDIVEHEGIVEEREWSIRERSMTNIVEGHSIDGLHRVDGTKRYFDASIFKLTLGFTLNELRGTIIKAKLLEFSIYSNIYKSVVDRYLNLNFRSKASLPFYPGRNISIVPSIEFYATNSSVESSYLKTNLSLNFHDIFFANSIPEDLKVDGFVKFSLQSNAFYGYSWGISIDGPISLRYCVGNLKSSIEIDGKSISKDRKSLFAAITDRSILSYDTLLSSDKIRLSTINVGVLSYYIYDFDLGEDIFALGPVLKFNIELYNIDIDCTFFYLFGNIESSRSNLTFNYTLGG